MISMASTAPSTPTCPVFAESSKPKARGAPGISRPCTAAATGCVMAGAPDVRTGPLHDLVSSLQFRLVAGFALTIVLTLAGAGIFISLATETQVERFETDQAMAQAGRVSEFISNHSIENRDPAEPGAELQSIVQQAADISGLRITTFDSQGNVVADSNPPYISNALESEGWAEGGGGRSPSIRRRGCGFHHRIQRFRP